MSDEEYDALEDKRYENFYEGLEKFLQVARPMWMTGDGNGGWVHEKLTAAMHDSFPATKPTPSKPNPPRPKISAELRTRVYERDAYRCVTCGSYKQLSLDHIHPKSLGGKHTFDNLQTLCRSCNSRKGAKA